MTVVSNISCTEAQMTCIVTPCVNDLTIVQGIIGLVFIILLITLGLNKFILKKKIVKKILKLIYFLIIITILSFSSASLFFINIEGSKDCTANENENCRTYDTGPAAKPIIYLYPQKKTKINVKLDYKGKIFADYPEYDEKIKGWNVTAYPDGKVIDNRDNKEYSYLFWEGNPEEKINWDLSKGFIVKGKDAREFLQAKLIEIGLTPKEYNEFIVYWYPIMMKNEYNLVHFAEEKYTDYAPLTITPKEDSMLRVFMVLKPLEEKIEIEEQELKHFERKGFSVIEWGGTILK